ncbi:hypothetical protein [Algivirga pacifica]
MKKSSGITLGLLILLLTTLEVQAQENQPWELVNQADNIEVYNRPHPSSCFKEFKVIARIKGSYLEKAKGILLDFNSYQSWMPACNQSKLISTEEESYYHYTTYDAPWPVSNRDLILNVQMEESIDSVIVYQQAAPDFLPEHKGFTRIGKFSGFWELVQENEWFTITYQASTDPGGKIPSWLSDMSTARTPLKTMQNLLSKLQ